MILVTGGTGLVGSHLLWELTQTSNLPIKATYRTETSKEPVLELFRWKAHGEKEAQQHFEKIDWVQADVTDVVALTNAFENVDCVYHCAALVSFNPKRLHELQKINIEGTANMVNLSLSCKVRKFCYVSSVAALGETENGTAVTEETHWDPNKENSVYSISKYASEMEVWRGTQEGLDVVIVNPGVILGEGFYNSGSGKMFSQIAKGLKYCVPGSTGFVDVKDVVSAMLTLMASEIKNEGFILVGENLKFKTLFDKISASLGKKSPQNMLKSWQLNLAWRIDWFLNTFFGTRRRLTKSTANSALTDTAYDSSKIKEQLFFKYTPIEESIERIASHFKSQLKN
tara:strand:- start:19960 stop:20985 length:1026 start_codon:yes stop_codon:yes gene_type:complete